MQFSAEKFDAGLVPYESPDQLNGLRAQLEGTHVVSRTRGGIACIPLVDEADLPGTPTTLQTREYRHLTMRLVQEAMLRLVLEWGYKLRKRVPPTFVSRLPGKDLLTPAVHSRRHDDLQNLHVFPQWVLDSRAVGPSNRPGIVIGLKTRYEIDMTVAELLDRGLSVDGLYVLAEDPTVETSPWMDRYASRRNLGAIDRIDGTDLVLRDAPGKGQVPASEAWPESRRETFTTVLAALAGADGGQITKELEQATFDLLGAFGRYEKTIEIASRLARRGPLPVARDLLVVLDPPVGSSNPRARTVDWKLYDEPVFQFDQSGDKTHRSVDRGLDEYGPFDAEFFAKKKPRIAVVAPRAHKGIVENFVTKFLYGVRGESGYSQGFIRKYHLGGCEVKLQAFDGDATDAGAYREACKAALRAGEVDLALVITSEAQVHLNGDDSPYLVAKSTFMGQGVPVQDVRIETARQSKLAYPLNSIALACYAKLGGVPFVIAAPRPLAQELVIGIGSAHVKSSRLSDPERIVGITTVFSADGNYLLSNTSREADYEDYPQELLRSLTECIDDIKRRNAWQRGDELRLVFHVFKPLKDIEATAVKELVEDLTRQYARVEFAFVHISTEHEWVMFDRASSGLANQRTRGQGKGFYVPNRGFAVPVGARDVLLAVSGPRDLKSALQGAPKPLLLQLHRQSTFTDMEYLSRQVFRFTSMSWRTVYPSSRPVTILYSDLIAELLGHLRHVRNWNADAVVTKLRSSRWFL
ncbi:argonaute/piwi family protein [Nocardia canadensis]|uniref:argonaute/piwi family protein n=1 Tax=Nocardia canadensis TaxID=3065238 RepID=UPI00292D2EE5|nr:Piwi domain-containing protein [Nocardia canadensis]